MNYGYCAYCEKPMEDDGVFDEQLDDQVCLDCVELLREQKEKK